MSDEAKQGSRSPTCKKSDRYMEGPGTCGDPFHGEPFRHGGSRHMKRGCRQCETESPVAPTPPNQETIALRQLRNEVLAILGIAREELRAIVGNTNMSVLQLRLDEALIALEPLSPAQTSHLKEECAAAKYRHGTPSGGDPVDCDFPFCGCYAMATKTIEALQECGWGKLPPAQTSHHTEEAERREFEADQIANAFAIKSDFLLRINGGYVSAKIQWRWEGWLARSRKEER